MLRLDKFKSLLTHPIVDECSSGLLLDISSDQTSRVVCWPISNAEKVDFGPEADSTELQAFELMISDKARQVSLYHHKSSWHICTSGAVNGDEELHRVCVQLDDKEEMVSFLAFRSKTHYNYWKILDETLSKPRIAFAKFLSSATIEEDAVTIVSPLSSVLQTSKTLDHYFWELWKKMAYQMPEDTTMTYTFAFSSPFISTCDHMKKSGSVFCLYSHCAPTNLNDFLFRRVK